MSETRKRVIINTFIYVFGLALLIVMLMPFVWLIFGTLRPKGQTFVFPPYVFPKELTLQNYVEVWKMVDFPLYMRNSLIVSGSGTASVIVVSALAAYALSILKVPGKGFISVMVFVGMTLPAQSGFIPLIIMVNKLGLSNTLIGIVLPYLSSCFGIFLMAQFYKTIPDALLDAARIDGLGEFGILLRIVIPLTKAGLATLIIFVSMNMWRDFFWPFLVVSKKAVKTMPVGIAGFYGEESLRWEYILPSVTISMAPLLIIYFIFQKQFVQGIAGTGIKG